MPALAVSESVVVPYPRAIGDEKFAGVASVRVNGAVVDTVGTTMNVGYAHFAIAGQVHVEIEVDEPIDAIDVSPHRYGIEVLTDGNVLSFILQTPRQLHVQINSLPRFFVFADPMDTDAPACGQPGVRDVTEFGVTSSTSRVQTRKLQRAMDSVAADRGVLFVPAGIYRCGQLRMPSNLTLHLAAGAILQGTGQLKDYPVGELGTQQIYWLDCKNSHIRGRGVIDGSGRALRLGSNNAFASRLKLLRAVRSSNCRVEGIVLRDAGSWAVHLVQSRDVQFDRCKLISTTIADVPDFPWELNTDGFDPDNCSNITIQNCFINCNDDAIAVKLKSGELHDMDGVFFRNNVVWTVKSALKIGTEVHPRRMTNIAFENNDVIHADRGIVVYCDHGATVENPRWVNNHFETIGGDLKQRNIDVRVRDADGKGVIRHMLIQDNTFEAFSPSRSSVRGRSGGHYVDGITIESLVVAGKKRSSLQDAQIEANKHVRDISFR